MERELRNDVMTDELFEKIISDLSDINYSGRISLFEINEPLTDPRIYSFTKYVSEHVPNAWQMLGSNGDLLDAYAARKLIDNGLDFLNISCYTDKALKKMKQLIQNVPTEYMDKILIFDAVNPSFATDNRGGNHPDITAVTEPLSLPCSRVNHVLYVKPNGNVVSCFGDYFDVNVMGNARDEHLRDIWFGEKFATLRFGLNRVNVVCPNCVQVVTKVMGIHLELKNCSRKELGKVRNQWESLSVRVVAALCFSAICNKRHSLDIWFQDARQLMLKRCLGVWSESR